MPTTRRTTTIAIAVIGLLGAVTFGLGLRARSQSLQPPASKTSDNESQQIQSSTDQALRVAENDDSPLRILEAKVKEISGTEFVKLTGKKTDLPTVSSVPEVRLLNSSPKTITGFILAVRDPQSKTTRGIVQSKLTIVPGATFTATRESFIRPEWVPDPDGKANAHIVRPSVNSEKYWLPFAGRAALFVTVARVEFQDGSTWTVKEGGDIR